MCICYCRLFNFFIYFAISAVLKDYILVCASVILVGLEANFWLKLKIGQIQPGISQKRPSTTGFRFFKTL